MVSKIKRDKSDLLGYKAGAFLFKNKMFLRFLRTGVFALFVYALVQALFFPAAPNHISLALFWSLFWPFFMVLSLATFGNAFCGICPHGSMGRCLTKIGLQKKVPKPLQNPLIGTAVLLLGYWTVLYVFHGIFHQAFIAGLFFLLVTLYAAVVFLVFDSMSYCKYFCPISSVTAVFSKAAFVRLGTYQSACQSCKDFACAKACPYGLSPFHFERKQSMSHCKLCMDCTHACEAVGLHLCRPGFGLEADVKQATTDQSWTVVLITAAVLIWMSFYNALGASPLSAVLPWNILAAKMPEAGVDFEAVFAFVFAAVFTIGITLGSYAAAAKVAQSSFSLMLRIASYSLVPLVLLGGLAQTLPFFLTRYGPQLYAAAVTKITGSAVEPASFVDPAHPGLRAFALLHVAGIVFALRVLFKRIKAAQWPPETARKLFYILGSFVFAYALLIGTIVYAYVLY